MRININVSNSRIAGKIGIAIFMIIASVFFVAGIGQILLGVFFLKFDEKGDDYVEIKAEISDISSHRDSHGDRSYDVFVDYTYEGVSYSDMKFNMYSSDMYIGEEIDILCDPNNPENITYKGSNALPSIILFFIGGMFTLISIIFLIVILCALKKPKDKKMRLKKKGVRVSAVVEEIIVDESASINGNTAYRIVCIYKDKSDGIIYKYRSDALLDDPSGFYYKGVPIDVLINPNDPSDYHVVVEYMQMANIVDIV